MTTQKFEIVDGTENKVIARVWWGGKKVESDSDDFDKYLDSLIKQGSIPGARTDKKLLHYMAQYFSNGYVHMRRAR